MFALTLTLGFLAELAIMMLFFPHDTAKLEMALLDSLTLTLSLAPVVYLLAYRPLRREVSSRRRAEESARDACTEAERANRAKDVFLAMLSHELRTPLTSILLRSESLLRIDDGNDRTRRAVESIARNARMQAHLIEDLLDLSRISSGKLRLEKKEARLATVVLAAMDSVRPAAQQKGVDIVVDLDPAVPPLEIDPRRIQQVVWNLLTNAVKFTPKGGQVAVRTVRTQDGVEIVVRDNGEGISPEFLPRIFELFSQADSTTTRAKGGLGLGLALVRQLAELHGGHVAAESPGLGKGTIFTVTLPPAEPARAALRREALDKRPTPETVSPLEGLRLLVIDDDSETRDALENLLGGLGASATSVPSASEARRAIQSFRPDALVCDIAMPDEDGYAFIRDLRSWPPERGGEIPALALTALAGGSDRQHALAVGFQEYLAKPTTGGELVSTVLRLVAARTKSAAPRDRVDEAPPCERRPR